VVNTRPTLNQEIVLGGIRSARARNQPGCSHVGECAIAKVGVTTAKLNQLLARGDELELRSDHGQIHVGGDGASAMRSRVQKSAATHQGGGVQIRFVRWKQRVAVLHELGSRCVRYARCMRRLSSQQPPLRGSGSKSSPFATGKGGLSLSGPFSLVRQNREAVVARRFLHGHTHTHTGTHRSIHAHIHIYWHTDTHLETRAYTYTHTCIHTHTYTCI
jgi:hypothetical protein